VAVNFAKLWTPLGISCRLGFWRQRSYLGRMLSCSRPRSRDNGTNVGGGTSGSAARRDFMVSVLRSLSFTGLVACTT
jgi:hypothetical protein